MGRHSGFTLLEMIAIILIVSVGVIGLSRLYGSSTAGIAVGANLQVMSQQAQSCAERVIATRRDLGFGAATLTSNLCDPAPSGLANILNMGAIYTGTSTSTCPYTAQCRDVVVTVCAAANTPCSGNVLKSSIKMMLVKY